MKKYYIIYLLFSVVLCSCYDREKLVDKRKLTAGDFRMFQQTPAWALAKAVDDEDKVEIMTIARKNPEIVNYQSSIFGETLLHCAIQQQKDESVRGLISAKADVNIQDSINGDTPLNDACSNNSNNLEIIKLLIDNGANVNALTGAKEAYYTPLMSACYGHFLEAAQLLLENGANINHMNSDGYTAFGLSLILEDYEMAYYLLKHGADFKVPIIYERDYSKEDTVITIRPIYIKEYMGGINVDYFTSGRKYYYKIIEYLKESGIQIEAQGERNRYSQ